MTIERTALPYFESPPVIETVLGVFFRPVSQLNSVWQGVFWRECLQSDFPEFELRPPTEEAVERFAPDSQPFQPEVRWQFSAEPEAPRLWAKSPTGEHILQVQRNALLANWLRRNNYRRFEERLREFESRASQLETFISRNSLTDGPLVPASCTVTYVNHIELGEQESWSTALGRTIQMWTADASDEWLPPVERARVQLSFAFPERRGRLHVSARPAQPKDTGNTVLQLELTGRVMLSGEPVGIPGLIAGLKTAHEWVVRGFTAITRAEMHQTWGRIQ
ncbi:MAG TPA: TIGR04255 family protein [Pirellulaceae bacterium]|nr:TIGR04255 family protein [Pirellulaceae bacterium]